MRESVTSVDALAPDAMRAVLPALRAARDELRVDLLAWLKHATDGDQRFTALAKRQALASLDGALERVGELEPAMGAALAKSRKLTGPLAAKNLETEIARLSAIFDGGVPTMPQINTAAVLAQGNKLLWRRHETSARRYAGAVGDDIRQQFAIGVAKGETFEQLVTRLRRLGDPGARKRGIDPGADAAGIADGMFRRQKHMADRLVRTEMMNAYNVQHDEAIVQANEQRPEGDDEYLRKWDAAADLRICPLCRELDGTVATLDGTFRGGIRSPPRHPYCRCVILAWMARWGDMRGEVPTRGPVPVRKEAKKPPPKKPKPEKKAAPAPVKTPPVKPTKAPRPAPAAPTPVPSLAGAGGEVMGHLVKGDLGAAVMSIDRHLADRGLVSQQKKNTGSVVVDDPAMTTLTHSGHTIVARASRDWNGDIQLSSQVANEISAYAKAVGTKDPARLEASIDTELEALQRQRVRLANLSRPTKAQRDELDAIRNRQEELRATSPMRAAAMNEAGVKTLVHETLHGFSPLDPSAYRGHGGQVEEVTTEVMARVVVRDSFGMKMVRHDRGSYSYDIEAATNAIAEITGKTPEQAYVHLQRSSERFKRRTDRMAASHEVVAAFASDIAAETGAPYGQARDALERHLRSAADRTAAAVAGAAH